MVMIYPSLSFFMGITFMLVGAQKCPCLDANECNPPEKNLGVAREVLAFSRRTSKVQVWSWDTITTLIVPSHFNISDRNQAETMCTAHRKGRKFGITVELNFTGSINETSEETKQWKESVKTKQDQWHADVVNINLLPYFTTDIFSLDQDHEDLVKILLSLKKELKQNLESVQVTCIVPWKPPCAEKDDSCDFTRLSNNVCDYFIINSDSFTDLDDVKCRARANIPMSKLLYGMSEYNSHQIANSRIILGVSWHGHDYICKKLTNDVCELPELPNTNSTQAKCDFNKRRMVTIGDIIKDHFKEYQKHATNNFYGAPFFSYNINTSSETHQIWFEDETSLMLKYKLVHELNLKGLGILYGDDLTPISEDHNLLNENGMWDWLHHEMALTASAKPLSERLHFAETMAIVSVACLLIGSALGIIFTCFGSRHCVKKPKRPFIRDADGDVEGYTDEDNNL